MSLDICIDINRKIFIAAISRLFKSFSIIYLTGDSIEAVFMSQGALKLSLTDLVPQLTTTVTALEYSDARTVNPATPTAIGREHR